MNKLIESQKGERGNSPYYPYSNIYYTRVKEHFSSSVFMPYYRLFFFKKKTSVFAE
jgi:hypothetical protein